MSEVNLEKLVAEYMNDELQPTCHNTPITYEIYEQLLDILMIKGTNVQHAMTTLIPQIHQEAIPPVHIQQLTRKVRTHLSRNKPKEDLISMLYPKKDDAQKISDYCSSAGITTKSLHSNETLNVSNAYLTNLLVYDLEKYRQKNKFPWSEAMKWHDRIFHSDPSYSITEQTISTKWSCNYAKINNLKVKKKTKELTAYLGAPHIPPIKKKCAKEQLIENLENPPLEEINASENPLIAMAEFQGAVIGTYVNKLEHNKVKQAKKIGQLKHTLDTITKEKVVLEKKKNLQSEKIQQMEVKLLQSKDTITQFKPKNVK